MVVPNPAIPPGQVVVHAQLLPPRAPNQWGAATTIGNPGQLPSNPPPAHVPAGGQLGQAPPGAGGPNILAAQVNVPAAGQIGQAPPGAAGPNVLAAQVKVAAADNLDRLVWVELVQTYRLHKSTSLLPDNLDRLPQVRLFQKSLLPENSDRLPWVGLVQTYWLHKSTSLMPDNSDRLPRVRLVQTYQLYKSTSLMPDSSARLPRVMFLRGVRMYLFNLVMILRTHTWYVIQVHQIMTLRRRKCYLIHCIMPPRQSKTNMLPEVFARHPTVGPQVSHFLNHQPVLGFYLLSYEIQIGALYLGVRALCVSFMSCRREVVWHYPSLKGIR